MKFSSIIPFVATVLAAPSTELAERDTVKGFDVSSYQPNVDFASAYKSGGLRFVYIKATEGVTYKDAYFSKHYDAATQAGFIRGGYHFASGGDPVAEADYFLAHGGGWSADGITLPGMLDLEGSCKSVSWIKSFSDRYHSKTGRYPTLYASPSWWKECTGNSAAFAQTNAYAMACWSSTPCSASPFPYYTFWQYKDSNPYGGDSDLFSASYSQLQKYARGS